jgi:hypothetical protein
METNWESILYLLTGVSYLIYSILCKDRVTYFSRQYSKNKKSDVKFINLQAFLRLQLNFSIANSIYLIIYGILINILNLNSVFVIVGPLPVHLLNFWLIIQSKNKGYIDYRVGATYK